MGLSNKDLSKIKRLLLWYNMVPSLFWSLVNLIPVSVFCYTLVSHKLLYILIAVSLLPCLLPNTFFDKIQLSTTPVFYKKLSINMLNRLVQNGSLINSLIKRKYPDYKAVVLQRSSIRKLIYQTYMNEKFHFIMFVFFCLVTGYAVIKSYFGWAILIFINNLIYNVYPNLLQQYMRLKLRRYKIN